ncbi:MAG: hypothetical protein IJF62_00320, partial [Firmicutes bacterium]|nr:hypothetical protein [Bacillota bacterium]
RTPLFYFPGRIGRHVFFFANTALVPPKMVLAHPAGAGGRGGTTAGRAGDAAALAAHFLLWCCHNIKRMVKIFYLW